MQSKIMDIYNNKWHTLKQDDRESVYYKSVGIEQTIKTVDIGCHIDPKDVQ